MIKPVSSLLITVAMLNGFAVSAETVTKRVDLDGIRHIYLLGTYDLAISQGSNEFVALTADSSELNNIEAKVQGSKLVLGRGQRNWTFSLFDDNKAETRSPRADVKFEVQVNNLRSVSNLGVGSVVLADFNSADGLALSNLGAGLVRINSITVDDFELNNLGAGRVSINGLNAESISENSTGAGRVDYENIHTDKWAIESSGSTHSSFSGSNTAKNIEVTLNGAGEVDADALQTEEAEITIKGVGVVRVNVSDELDVDINGTGKVYYGGSPKIKQKISAMGELIAIDQ